MPIVFDMSALLRLPFTPADLTATNGTPPRSKDQSSIPLPMKQERKPAPG
jgi:hypothetical protein